MNETQTGSQRDGFVKQKKENTRIKSSEFEFGCNYFNKVAKLLEKFLSLESKNE